MKLCYNLPLGTPKFLDEVLRGDQVFSSMAECIGLGSGVGVCEMFSGIVKTTGAVTWVRQYGKERRVGIRPPAQWKLKPGESISVEGVCSTVQKVNGGSFEVTYMPETLRKTTLSGLQSKSRVNLERSLTLNSLIGGHLVQGHVDVVGRIVSIRPEETSKIYTFEIPRRLTRYLVEKGSVAIDGISLTVVDLGGLHFSVSLLDYTLRHTTLGAKGVGDSVNIEVDVLSKYVAKLLGK